MAKITVIIQTYNRANMLQRAIDSVLKQSFKDFELIIIDNGSIDNTQKLIESYYKTQSKFFCIKRKKNDIGMALAKTIDKAINYNSESNYCMFLDDDDFMAPTAIEILYNLISTTDADIAAVGSQFFYPDGTTENKYVYEGTYSMTRVEAMYELLKREKINSARGGKLYKKSILCDIEYPDELKIRDIHREYRVMNNIQKMAICGEPLYYFYRHDNNSSGLSLPQQITPERLREHLTANRERTIWLSRQMPEIDKYVYYCEISFMLSLYERIYRLKVNSCYEIAEYMKTCVINSLPEIERYGFFSKKETLILSKII